MSWVELVFMEASLRRYLDPLSLSWNPLGYGQAGAVYGIKYATYVMQ